VTAVKLGNNRGGPQCSAGFLPSRPQEAIQSLDRLGATSASKGAKAQPIDLAVRAMASHQLGRTANANAALDQLRSLVKIDPSLASDQKARLRASQPRFDHTVPMAECCSCLEPLSDQVTPVADWRPQASARGQQHWEAGLNDGGRKTGTSLQSATQRFGANCIDPARLK